MARQDKELTVGEIPTCCYCAGPADAGRQRNVEVLWDACDGVDTAYDERSVSFIGARQGN